jgi:secreted trypsin-like serine protease
MPARRIAFGIPVLLCTGAAAMVGGAPPADPALARHLVLLVGSHGTSCSGVAVARSIVLTAAHCVQPDSEYRVVTFDAAHKPTLKAVDVVAQHPGFALATLLAHRATADVALLKLSEPLPASFAPAPLASASATVAAGDALTVAGYGVAVRGDGATGGTARAATLVATGQPGSLQIRLMDPAGKGERAGLGACTGDSGAPVFAAGARVIGVVSWSTGPKLAAGCGGLTGVTPLARYRAWIVETAATMGATLAP